MSLECWVVLALPRFGSPNIRAWVVGNALPIPAGFCWLNPLFAQNLAKQPQKPLQFVSSLILRLVLSSPDNSCCHWSVQNPPLRVGSKSCLGNHSAFFIFLVFRAYCG
jgi:hypothetical protein